MQQDFHYYATYCAAILAGYSHEESMRICFSAEMVDHCSKSFLKKIHGDMTAATTQLQLEMANADTSIIGLQDITRIWASFHFLPFDLYRDPGKGSRMYKNKYRLLCDTNGDLLIDTIKLAGKADTLPAVGLSMHILADTWAHRYFAGTPSFVINNTDYYFYEVIPKTKDAEKTEEKTDGGKIEEDVELKESRYSERKITFSHKPSAKDDLEKGIFINTVRQSTERSVMNLGHGRAGHLPDYSFMRYKYLPAWGDYAEIIKDNPSDYYHAFCQMIYAMKYLRGEISDFENNKYAWESVEPLKEEIQHILEKRQYNACDDWKALGERLSGCQIEAFDTKKYEEEYMNAKREVKENTLFGEFIRAALSQKQMVTGKIFQSGNLNAGLSVTLDSRLGKILLEKAERRRNRE